MSCLIAAWLIVRPGWSAPVVSVIEVDGEVQAFSTAVASGPASDPLLIGSPIDVNTASAALLDEIPAVGASSSAAIVAERERGVYRDLADLDARVPKLSAAALDGIAGWATFSGPFPPDIEHGLAETRRSPRRAAGVRFNLPATAAKADPTRVAKSPRRKPDPNTASAADLDRLPGIGPAIAARILADRAANGAYATVDDLDRVPGIGPATVEKLRQLVEIR